MIASRLFGHLVTISTFQSILRCSHKHVYKPKKKNNRGATFASFASVDSFCLDVSTDTFMGIYSMAWDSMRFLNFVLTEIIIDMQFQDWYDKFISCQKVIWINRDCQFTLKHIFSEF